MQITSQAHKKGREGSSQAFLATKVVGQGRKQAQQQQKEKQTAIMQTDHQINIKNTTTINKQQPPATQAPTPRQLNRK